MDFLDLLFGNKDEVHEHKAAIKESKPYHERYYEENRIRLKENVKNWRANNREHYREYQRQWYHEHKKQRLEYLRERRQKIKRE